VARPTLSIRLIGPQAVQVAARVRLESVHDFLGSNLRFYHRVNMIGSHMCCPQAPAMVQTDFPESIEYCRTAVSVEQIGQLVHLLAFQRDAFGIDFRHPRSGHIVVPVDRTGFITVQMRPIASESDEVPQSEPTVPLLYSRGSANVSFGQCSTESITSVSHTPFGTSQQHSTSSLL
jgi:hypothetical protein